MRCLVKTGDTWKREHTENVSAWLWQHDGAEAVCVDDATKTYYCATEALREEYAGQGKDAAMFIDLDRQLFTQDRG